MGNPLSPKDLAGAIGVSESSLKRWVDQGRLHATRTAGGHRRIDLQEAVRFIRTNGSTIVCPQLLGAPELTDRVMRSVHEGRGEIELFRGLVDGADELVRGLVLAHYLALRSLASVCDGPIAFAVRRVSALAARGGLDPGRQAAALAACAEAVRGIRRFLPAPRESAPAALLIVGGAPASQLAAAKVSACLAELGIREASLAAAGVSAERIAAEARVMHARMIWLDGLSETGRTGVSHEQVALACGDACEVICGPMIGAEPLRGVSVHHALGSLAELGSLVRAAVLQHGSREDGPGRAGANGHIHGVVPSGARPRRERAGRAAS